MNRISLPSTEFFLLLTPDASVPPAFALVLLAIIPFILALWLSSYELRSLSLLPGLGLLSLRIIALIGLLVVSWSVPGFLLPALCAATALLLLWLFSYDLSGSNLGVAVTWLMLRLAVIFCLWLSGLLWPSSLLPLLCVVSVALVAWLCWYELQVVRRSTALLLLSLRLVVIFLFWFIICLQPILARPVSEEMPGRVLIAVDRSESMDVVDPQREPAAKLRLARALKLTGDIPDAQLEDWIRQYDAKATPQWVAANEFPDAPERRREAAAKRRQQHDDLCKQVDALTRTQIARKVLTDDGAALLATITGKHKVELLGFAGDKWDVKLEQLDELFRTMRGQGTDLRAPLVRALERSGPEHGKVLGVVVLTDGQHNGKESPVPKAIELGERKLPIYPVALGARKPPPDVAIVSVSAPERVFKDVDVGVEARFKVTGLPAQDIVVEMKVPGKDEPEKQTIKHDGTDRLYDVSFRTRLDKPGTQSLAVSARPVTGETRPDNNSRSAVISVADDKAKVLVIDGEARWEYHYLANALARDRTVKLQNVVFLQPRVNAIQEDELQKLPNQPARTLPTDPDALAGYDCIVLGDVSPAQLPPAERIRLEKYVADRGGTLVILAGKRYMPLAFLEGQKEAGEGGEPLLNLLPIEAPRVVQPLKGFPVTLTDEGQQRTRFLQLDETLEESGKRWAELPRHFWGVVGRAKKNAAPLAYVQPEELPNVKTDRAAQEKENALFVRQNYGFGRVLYVGLDSTWRWRYKVGDAYHHRFWGQLVRWAAADKPLVAGNEFVRFGTREPLYRQGSEVEVVVRLSDELGGPGRPPLSPDALAGARILRSPGAGKPEEAVAVVPLTRPPAQPRVLEGRVRDLPVGQYSIELAIPELADKLQVPPTPDGQPGKLRAAFTVAPADSQELVELGTNWPLLQELASKSGGQVYTAENAGELVEKLTNQTLTREYRTERKLWHEWGTLALFLLLLTVEWVGRKLAGLP